MSDALNRAIELCGGQTGLARKIGKTQAHISVWLSRGRVPPDIAVRIEKVTDGAVRCEDLHPAVDWSYLRGTAPASASPEVAST